MAAVLFNCRRAVRSRGSDGIIHLPLDASPFSRSISEKVGPTVCDLPKTLVPELDDNDLSLGDLRIPTTAKMLRVTQPLFRSKILKHRTLWVPSWVSLPLSRADSEGISLYRRSLHRSAIPSSSARYNESADARFPHSLDEFLFRNRIESHPSTTRWSAFEKEIVVSEIETKYQKMRSALVAATAQFESILDFYSPIQANLLDDAWEHWTLMYELCRLRSVKTTMYVDGYQVTPISPYIKNHHGTDLVCDKVAAYGEAQAQMYAKAGIAKRKIAEIEPPFLEYLAKATDVLEDSFDVVVLTWTPFLTNPAASRMSPPKTLRTVLRCLISSGFKRIAVKIRWEKEREYVEQVLEEFDAKIVVLEGRFWKYAKHAAALYIGGISTTFAEAALAGKNYIVYEPTENGYPDVLIAQAVVTNRQSIARSESELEDLLAKRGTSWIAKE